MILSLLQRYSLKSTFALTLLIGLQLPHFLAQYEARIDAHYRESKTQLSHYQQLADLLFSGDLNGLVAQHKNSDIALFKAEAIIIEQLITRTHFLQTLQQHLQGPLYKRFVFLLTQINEPLFIETQHHYQADVVLNKQSITVGVSVALVMSLLLEMLFMLIALLIKKIGNKQQKKTIN